MSLRISVAFLVSLCFCTHTAHATRCFYHPLEERLESSSIVASGSVVAAELMPTAAEVPAGSERVLVLTIQVEEVFKGNPGRTIVVHQPTYYNPDPYGEIINSDTYSAPVKLLEKVVVFIRPEEGIPILSLCSWSQSASSLGDGATNIIAELHSLLGS